MKQRKQPEKEVPNELKGFSREQLLELLARLAEHLRADKGVHVPVGIFAAKLSPAEALVKYLKEHEQLRYADIARALNRDQRGIWCTYRRAQQKHPQAFAVKPSPHTVPVSLFTERKFSILEHVVRHLRGTGMPLKDIAGLVNKHPSTIATVHSRVRRKLQ
jgi:DNA-binding transcriptional MerR regulator